MSRGGRRRKGKRGRRSAGPGERRPQPGQQEGEELEPQPPRRRGSGRGGQPREISVLEQMATRHTPLQTLPPDGLVLEELIGALQSEYGVPTTPQEYRLIIKTRQPDEPTTDPSIEVKPVPKAQGSGPEAEAANEAVPAAVGGRPPGIRRRRRRRSGGSSASAGAAEPDGEAGDSSAAG